MNVFKIFKGKLSYTLSFFAILWAVAGYLFFGLDGKIALEILWAGLAVFGLRRAIPK